MFHAISSWQDANVPMLEFLLKRSAEWIDWTAKATFRVFGETLPPLTPMDYALRNGDEATASPAKKRELQALRTADDRGRLKEAMRRRAMDEIKEVLDAHPDYLDIDLWPVAIFQGKSLEITRLLLDRGLNPDECSAPRKPLHLGVYQCLPDIVELLIARGADVNLRNPLGETPLDLLDAYEPRPVGDPDSRRIRTALLAAGANDTLSSVIRAGDTGQFQKMLESGAGQARVDADLGDALFVAARSGREEMAKLLLEAGADPDRVNGAGNTPLWFAAQSSADALDRIAVMKLLLEAGADINRRCEDGTTALHFAAWRGPVEVAEFLLSQGARGWIIDDKGKTPADYAKELSIAADKDAIVRLFSEVRILSSTFRTDV